MNIGMSGKNVTTKVASVIFAFVLWFNTTTNGTFTFKIELPIHYVGPSEGFVFTGDRPDHITATIEGSGKTLVAFSAARLFHTGQRYALVNLTSLPKGTHQITIDRENINLAVDSDLAVASILYPDNATFPVTIDREVAKSLPVRADSIEGITMPRGFTFVRPPLTDPPHVVVKGAEDVVKTMTEVRPMAFDNRRISLSDSLVTAELDMPEYTMAEPAKVALMYHLEPIKERRLTDIPVRLDGFPDSVRPRLDPDSVTVIVSGAETVVKSLDPGSFRVFISSNRYRELIDAGDSLIAPESAPPGGILVVEILPQTIRIHGEQ